MAVYDLEEQEQISQLKGWWEENGKLVTTIIVIAALISVGWQGLRWYQNKQATGASALYAEVMKAAEQNDAVKARELTGQILSDYSDTAYASMAALLSGRAQVAAGDSENAKMQLQWVVDKSSDAAFKQLARLHLATIALDTGDHASGIAVVEEGLKALEEKDASSPELQARFQDLLGDLYAAGQQVEQARAAYQAALDALQSGMLSGGSGSLGNIVRLKLESLEG